MTPASRGAGSKHDPLPAIRAVLAAYRSTKGHISEEQITAAWSEYEAAREALRRER